MKKTILIAASNFNVGGVQKSLLSLLQSINYTKYDVDLLLLKYEGVLLDYIPKQVNVITPPDYYKWIFIPKNEIYNALQKSLGFNLNVFRLMYCIFIGFYKRNMGQARQLLWKLCKHTLPNIAKEYDVAIDYTGGFKGILSDKINAKKKVTWIHSDYRVFKKDKMLDNEYFSKFDHIVSVSQTCHDIFNIEFPQYTDKHYVVPNIIIKSYIQQLSEEKFDLDVGFKGLKIIDVTRLDPNKGLDIAVQTCKKLIESGYNIKWYILGDGPEEKKIKELIRLNNLDDRFILLGLKDNPYPYIKSADIFVHCSLFEGRSVAIDEAMLLAKPIIVTDYPTAKDQITNGETGLICKATINDIYDTIKLLIENKQLRNEMIKNLLEYEISVDYSLNILEEIFNGEK